MEIRHISTKKIIIVQFEQLPFNYLVLDETAKLINDVFHFKGIELLPKADEQPLFLFSMGTLADDKDNGLITKIEIERRRILIEVDGDSKFADSVHTRLREVFQEIEGPPKVEMDTIIESYDSLIISQLDFHANQLIEPGLISIINGPLVDESKSDIAFSKMNHFILRFRMDYFISDEKMKEYKVTISPKVFSLGPRDGTLLSEQLFLSEAPLDTATHVEILKRIEAHYSR